MLLSAHNATAEYVWRVVDRVEFGFPKTRLYQTEIKRECPWDDSRVRSHMRAWNSSNSIIYNIIVLVPWALFMRLVTLFVEAAFAAEWSFCFVYSWNKKRLYKLHYGYAVREWLASPERS